jgi:hypothetical protein
MVPETLSPTLKSRFAVVGMRGLHIVSDYSCDLRWKRFGASCVEPLVPGPGTVLSRVGRPSVNDVYGVWLPYSSVPCTQYIRSLDAALTFQPWRQHEADPASCLHFPVMHVLGLGLTTMMNCR